MNKYAKALMIAVVISAGSQFWYDAGKARALIGIRRNFPDCYKQTMQILKYASEHPRYTVKERMSLKFVYNLAKLNEN